MAHHHDEADRIRLAPGGQHVPEQGLAADLMQHLGGVGLHPRTFARGQDDDRSRTAHTHLAVLLGCCSPDAGIPLPGCAVMARADPARSLAHQCARPTPAGYRPARLADAGWVGRSPCSAERSEARTGRQTCRRALSARMSWRGRFCRYPPLTFEYGFDRVRQRATDISKCRRAGSERAIALRRAGHSLREIKQILGIGSNQTLHEALRGEPPPEWTRRPRAKDDLHARARELRAQGLDYDDIAAALGVSKSSVSLWVRDMPRPERLSYEECRKRVGRGIPALLGGRATRPRGPA